MSLPYFDKMREPIVLATPNGIDHGFLVFIARNPVAGRRNRYSVMMMDCETNKISACAVEVDIKQARKYQLEYVEILMSYNLGINPQRIIGWNKFERIDI